jgi:8-oxo-dGTP pyrophosphatase MutT (NUDIX family)
MVKHEIEKYTPYNEQEMVDKQAMLRFIETNDDVLDRDNLVAHLTSSAIVVNESLDKVLFAYHNIYDSWAWVGGHNDGDADLLNVAIKEAKEETGIKRVRPYSEDIFMLDIIHVTNHIKHGKYVPDHLHLNVTYLLIADEDDDLQVKHDENSGVKWFFIDDVLNYVKEERMKSVYQKAFQKIKSYNK